MRVVPFDVPGHKRGRGNPELTAFLGQQCVGVIKMLDLRRPIYKQTAAYGHFGRNDLDLPWEKLDRVDTLKAYLK